MLFVDKNIDFQKKFNSIESFQNLMRTKVLKDEWELKSTRVQKKEMGGYLTDIIGKRNELHFSTRKHWWKSRGDPLIRLGTG